MKLTLMLTIVLAAGTAFVAARVPNMFGNRGMGQEGSNICNSEGLDHYLQADPADCHKFYSCVFDGTHYIAYHFTCPAKLAFDDVSKSCQYEETVESCKPRPTEPVPTTTTTEPEPETTTTTQPTTQKPEPTTTTPETTTTEPEPEPTTPHPETTTSEAEPEPTEPEPEPTTEAPKPSDKYCPEGWKLNGDSCYFFSRSKAGSFDKALDNCQALGGYLVEIDSEEEDQFVVAEVTALSPSSRDVLDYWLGGEDRDKDGVWTWATSGNPVTYSNWWNNQGKLKGDCMQLVRNGQTVPRSLDSFYWARNAGRGCSNDGDNGFICEREALTTMTEVICEHKEADLACEEGTVKVESAFYGRQDRKTCPSLAILNTNCAADRLEYVQTQCEGQTSCRVKSSNQFGDPCRGTYKYTEITYRCV